MIILSGKTNILNGIVCVVYKDTQKKRGVWPDLSIWHLGHPEICHSCHEIKCFTTHSVPLPQLGIRLL